MKDATPSPGHAIFAAGLLLTLYAYSAAPWWWLAIWCVLGLALNGYAERERRETSELARSAVRIVQRQRRKRNGGAPLH